ncbi:MAG: hypothetical protein ACK4F9_01365 [Brevinematia bacterium]
MSRLVLTFVVLFIFYCISFGSNDIEKFKHIVKVVVIPEKKLESDEYTMFSVSYLNSVISEMGIEYVEPVVLDKIKKKVKKVLEEKSGEAVSFSQLLASESGANVYLEVSTKVEEKRMENLTKSYSGVPQVDLKQVYVRIIISLYDVSTGRGLGKTVVSTNVPVAGNTPEKIEKIVAKLSKDGLDDSFQKLANYLSKGSTVYLKFMGVKDLYIEREISKVLDSLASVKMKKRKGMSGGYVDYDVVITGTIDEFTEELRDAFDNTYIKINDITLSQNLILVSVK